MPKTINLIQQYLDQLTPIEIATYEIAKEHLGSSFNIEKSIGFIEWKKKKEVQNEKIKV